MRRRANRTAPADDGEQYEFMTPTSGTQLVERPGDVDQVLEYGPRIPTLRRFLSIESRLHRFAFLGPRHADRLRRKSSHFLRPTFVLSSFLLSYLEVDRRRAALHNASRFCLASSTGSIPSLIFARARRADSRASSSVTSGNPPSPMSRLRPPTRTRRIQLRPPDGSTCSARPATPPTKWRPGSFLRLTAAADSSAAFFGTSFSSVLLARTHRSTITSQP